jgi:hypothetical protein
MKTKIKLLLLFIFSINTLFAQKFAGGEIRAQQTGTYSVVATVDIFTAINVDLETIKLCWGDGLCEDIPLVYSESFPGSSLKFYQFQQSHIYGQENYYTLSVNECCWGANIINIENAETENFLLSTYFFLSIEDPLFGKNSMPIFSRGLLEGYEGIPISYESNFFDLEEDEVNVQICDLDEVLTSFRPTEVYPGPFNVIYLDTMTSSFFWSAPQLDGRYVLALCVRETRNGVLLSEHTRKMSISVAEFVANEEVFSANQINLSPNPVSDKLTIAVPEDWKDVKVAVFDVMGRKVTADFFGNQLDVTGLDNGLYLIQVRSGDRFFSGKMVVE